MSRTRSYSSWAIAGAMCALLVDALYIYMMYGQHPHDLAIPRVRFVAATLLVAVIVTLVGAVRGGEPPTRTLLLSAVFGLLWALGIVAMFSIGTLLLLAGTLILVALVREIRKGRTLVQVLVMISVVATMSGTVVLGLVLFPL